MRHDRLDILGNCGAWAVNLNPDFDAGFFGGVSAFNERLANLLQGFLDRNTLG